jgi:hypothetical protein
VVPLTNPERKPPDVGSAKAGSEESVLEKAF